MICAVCGEHITNPIAPQRMATQVSSWLSEEKLDAASIVADALVCFDAFPKEEMCIITKESMAICPHCFACELKEMLPLSKQHKEDFERQFTYHIFPLEVMG